MAVTCPVCGDDVARVVPASSTVELGCVVVCVHRGEVFVHD
jgi:hypothetical protein